GALHDVLQVFDQAQISMTRIESRPLRQGKWEYMFFIDVEGHLEEEPLKNVASLLEERTGLLRVLGSYPRALSPAKHVTANR
ncbi:MAG: ACT domain-containing protein, partial [Pseudomonadota bacterium]